MTLFTWIRRNWQTVSYFILFFSCIGFASLALWKGWDNKTSSGEFFQALALGIIASMLASGALMLFITYRDSKRLSDIDENMRRLGPLGDQFALDEIDAVLRNAEVRAEMWISLICGIESDSNPVYFVGSSLRRWRERHVYSKPLVDKLRPRMEQAKKLGTNHAPLFQTYFCVTDPSATDSWAVFLRNEVLANNNADLKKYGVNIINISSTMPYSAVCSSRNLVVTPYTANRNVEESLSIFMRTTGSFYDLYVKDVLHCISLGTEY
jgi:hypothetical protein